MSIFFTKNSIIKNTQYVKKYIKLFIPPIVLVVLNKLKKKQYGWFGDYDNWTNAQNYASGYDSSKIIKKIKEASMKVRDEEVAYERDGALYNKIYYSWPLLSSIMLSSIQDGHVNVLDYGGSLGTSYFQNKKFLDNIECISWNIVEQKHFVDTGKKYFENDKLHFYYDIKSCLKENKCNILILAGVLQYIENPYSLLDEVFKFDIPYILIDRTPFIYKECDQITLQIVSPNIYDASYPCWFFDKYKMIDYFTHNHYTLVEEFDVVDELDGKNEMYAFKGMLWKNKYGD